MSAWAGSAIDELEGRLAAHPAAGMVAACEPVTELSTVFRSMVLPPALSSTLLPRLLGAATADDAAGAGFDRAGAVTVVAATGEGIHELRIAFSGTAEQAAAVVAGIDPGATLEETGTSRFATGDRAWRARLDPGWLVVGPADAPPASDRPRPDPLLAGIDGSVHGCAVWVSPPPKPDVAEPDTLAAFLPFTGSGPLVVRFRMEDMPAELDRTDAVVPVGRTDRAPSAVATVSAPVGPLLGALLGEQVDLLGALDGVRIAGGASAAVFGNPRQGAPWVGVIALTSEAGRPVKVKRLVRTLAEDPTFERLSATTLRRTHGNTTVYAELARDGRVAVGSDPIVTATALGDEGEPWLDAAGLAKARTAPVQLWTTGPRALTITARPVEGRMLEFALAIEWSPAERAAFRQSIGPMIGMMVPMVLAQSQAGLRGMLAPPSP